MKSKLVRVVAFSLLIGILISSQSSVTASKKLNKKPKLKPYFNRLLVKFKKGISLKQKRRIIASVGKITKSPSNNLDFYVLSPTKKITDSLRFLRKRKEVKYASVDYKRRLFYTPTDPQYSLSQWSLDAMNVKSAWDLGQAQGWLNNNITIAVVDTGMDTDHPDLQNNLWVNPGEVASNSTDDDGNGYVDDVNGYSWSGLSNWPDTSYIDDLNLGAVYANNSMQSAAQAITGTGGKIKSIGFYATIERTKRILPKDITVSLTNSVNNRPGTTLASYTLKPSDIPYDSEEDYYDGWVEKPLSATVTLNQSSQYFIVLSTQNSSRNVYYTFYYSTYDQDFYTGGNLFFKINNHWVEQLKSDLIFATDATGANIQDIYGHGSYVSGIIGATHNSAGGAGIVPGARLMTLRVGDDSGTISDSAVIEAIHYAVDNGAKVINLSLGGPYYSAALQEATDYAYNNGVTVVASSGNDGEEVDNYPASNRDVISVGAMTGNNSLADFSTLSDNVDVTAPGFSVFTTDNGGGYEPSFSGTSASAPQVSGMAALYKLQNPTLGAAAVSSRIINTADDLGDKYRDEYYGHGQVNFSKAFGSTSFSDLDTSKKTDVYYGTVIPLTATLKVGSWSPSNALANTTLKGQFKPSGFPLWLPLTEGITNSEGKISNFIFPMENTEVRFLWEGNNDYQRSFDEFTIYVRALVHINVRRLTNGRVRISGKVSPEHRGRVSLLRRLPGESWKGIATGRLDRYSRYYFVTKPRRGTNWYRVKFPGDDDHKPGYSMKKKIIGR